MTNTDRNFNRLTISRHDFEKCGQFLSALSSEKYGTIQYEALLFSAIIFYSRPFSCNEKGSNALAASRVDNFVLGNLSDNELELHKLILELRNKAIAHAEWNFNPTKVDDNKIMSSMPFSIWKYFQDSADIAQFAALRAKVLDNSHNLAANTLHRMP